MATTDQTKPSFSTAQAAVQISRDNVSWSSALGQGVSDLTYGFRDTAPPANYGNGESKTFSKVNDEQKEAVVKVLAEWADVANISLKAVNPTGFTNNATILMANFELDPKIEAAHAYLPSTKDIAASSLEGDFWFNSKVTLNNFAFGSYSYSTVLHELGHALGLPHPGSYNADDKQEGATYEKDAVYREDSLQYTIMSYFDASKTGANHTVGDTTYYGSTPLLDDIAAIQRLYGPNTNTRTGDTTYGFNGTETDSPFNIKSANQQVVFSIWDAGGSNTLDLSGYVDSQVIDLRAGHFSNAGKLTGNISIALGTMIHNGIGGSGDDTIYGNDADNVLTGNNGNDLIDGGLGTNAAVFSGPIRNYEVTLKGDASPFTVSDRVGTDGTDTLTSIQELRFDAQNLPMSDFILARGLFSADHGFFSEASNIFGLYMAEENRAPDALGLLYWVARVAQGVHLVQIADSFFDQPETRGVYSPTLSNAEFVTAAYHNLFARPPEKQGLDYWVSDLTGGMTRGAMLYGLYLGALGNDQTIINNKETVAINFAEAKGLNNAGWARDVLSQVDATAQSVTEANQKILSYATIAGTPETAELVVKFIGVPDSSVS